MRELCHRCHAELPEPAAGSSRGDEDAILFCPRCAAPQIHLPEHMRTEPAATVAPTTGELPPPRLFGEGVTSSFSQIDWRAALRCGAFVAAVAALLTVLSFAFAAFTFFGLLWTFSAASVALGLYARLRPQAKMDARIGMKVGVTAGVLLLAAIGIGLAATGVILRFGTHSMEQFDKANTEQRKQVVTWVQQNVDDKDLAAKLTENLTSPRMNTPEMHAANALGGMALQSVMILFICAGSGAFAGRLRGSQAARASLRQGD